MKITSKSYHDEFEWGFGSSDKVFFLVDRKKGLVAAISTNYHLDYTAFEVKRLKDGETLFQHFVQNITDEYPLFHDRSDKWLKSYWFNMYYELSCY